MTYEFLKETMGCEYFYHSILPEELSTVLVDKWYVEQNGQMILGVNTKQDHLTDREILPV